MGIFDWGWQKNQTETKVEVVLRGLKEGGTVEMSIK